MQEELDSYLQKPISRLVMWKCLYTLLVYLEEKYGLTVLENHPLNWNTVAPFSLSWFGVTISIGTEKYHLPMKYNQGAIYLFNKQLTSTGLLDNLIEEWIYKNLLEKL